MVYVDKTAYIYRMVRTNQSYFLSRPRRFGKSLLLSTMQAFFEGRRELFRGLAIEQLEQQWTVYPVIAITLGISEYKSEDSVRQHLHSELRSNAKRLGVILEAAPLANQFKQLIEDAACANGRGVVILIDEYDKPLQDILHADDELFQSIRDLLRTFYGCVKECGEHLRFVMMTGVTKFGQVSVFSGLNNLIDISLEPWSNAICGISETEMQSYFKDDIAKLGELNGMSSGQAAELMRQYYDGYRFAVPGENIYNPYSVMNAFTSMRLGSYWFESGTPSSLLRYLIKYDFDLSNLEHVEASTQDLRSVTSMKHNPVSLLYQTGYLTIKDYDAEDGMYVLGFPNREVKSGFYENLLEAIYWSSDSGFSASKVRMHAVSGEVEQLLRLLQSAVAEYNYQQHTNIKNEYQLNGLLYGITMAWGLHTKAEYNICSGRIDMYIQTKRYLYLMEFKVNSTPDAAIKQIDDKDYTYPFRNSNRTIYKIGLNYNTSLHRIDGYKVVDLQGKILAEA